MKKTLIKGGRVVDPKQGINRISNLMMEDNRIRAVTDEAPEADEVIDASGKVVCPGFIDMHMHEDELEPGGNKIKESMSISALKMGVTTDVAGNCGDNVCDPDKFLDLADRDGVPVNIAMLAGHIYLRNHNGRRDKYKPIGAEDIRAMTEECRSFLDAGCLGVSFGVKYVPGTTWNEMYSLARLCAGDQKIVASHVRQDVDGVFQAADELAELGREAGVRVQFSHIGSMGAYGQMETLLQNVEEYRMQGIDMMCDCYPYTAFSTEIGATTYDPGFLDRYKADYGDILIVNGKYEGQRCTEAIYEDLRQNAPDTSTIGYFMKEDDIERALVSPLVMIGSDGVRTDGLGHPRASGTFPRFISDYIRPGKVTLLDGVRKMTTMAADRLHLSNKGNFITGSDADVVVFDLDKTEDKATYENGQIPPTGIEQVFIGGQRALKDGIVVNKRLGRAVRR